MIDKVDLSFVMRETGLDKSKAKLLTEEPRDFQLILETLSKRDFSKEELISLSPRTYFRIIVYKFSHNSEFSLEDKTYVADCLVDNFETIRHARFCKRVVEKSDEKRAEQLGRYFFAAVCFKNDEFKKFFKGNHGLDYYLNHITHCFSLCGKRDFSRHTEKWIEIIQKIKQEKFFQTDKPKKSV